MGVAISRRSLAEERLEMDPLIDVGGGRTIPKDSVPVLSFPMTEADLIS
jgi:hypothetical protein